MREVHRFTATVLAFGFLVGAAAQAQAQQQGQGSGRTTGVPVTDVTLQAPDGRTIQRQTFSGFSIADDPGNPFHQTNVTCTFTTAVAADGETVSQGAFCDGIDRDWDVFWLWGRGNQDGGTWSLIGGTGKFEGIEGGGTSTTAATWPDGKIIFSWEGSWTMK